MPPPKHGGDVALDVRGGEGPARGAERFVFVDEDGCDDADGVRPFVEQLVQDAGVGVLGYKAGAEEFEAFGCYFPDDAGVVQEPPAAKGVYVGEFATRDAEFVLVLAREEGDEEVDVGPVACDAFEVGDVPFAQAVAAIFEGLG